VTTSMTASSTSCASPSEAPEVARGGCPAEQCSAGLPLSRRRDRAPGGAGSVEGEPLVVVGCGALGPELREALARLGVEAELRLLPPVLHDRPASIPAEVARAVEAEQSAGRRVVVAYADCGTYGRLDEACDSLGVERLEGLHCYDVLAGAGRVRALLEEEPGTYLLTDFLVRRFRSLVWRELGLDRHPELWNDYFGHYRRVVWLAGRRTPEREAEAERIAELFGAPLEVVEVGTGGLEAALGRLVGRVEEPSRAGSPAAGGGG
jgi:hypothetical protein